MDMKQDAHHLRFQITPPNILENMFHTIRNQYGTAVPLVLEIVVWPTLKMHGLSQPNVSPFSLAYPCVPQRSERLPLGKEAKNRPGQTSSTPGQGSQKVFWSLELQQSTKIDGQYFPVGFMPFLGKLRLNVMVKVDPKRYSFTSGLPLYNLNLSLLHRFQSACLHVLGHIASVYFEARGVVNSLHLANQI